ncbi:MAG: response regulator [Verrucomicrobiae bacterium]|nr:response regulator [Verrucomicrobiae bacterium]
MEGRSKGWILVAEDDALFGATLERVLRHHGYECRWVKDVSGAVTALSERPYDLLISDIHMPGNDGLALVEHLRAAAPEVPIILLTGRPTLETAMQSVGPPVVGYLVKPPEPGTLLALIERGMGARRRARAWREREAQLRECLREFRALPREGEVAEREEGEGALNRVMARFEEALRVSEHWGLEMSAGPTAVAPGVAPGLSGSIPAPEFEAVLREVIGALDATRRHFKSRELGQLRRRLEGLIQSGGTGSEGGAHGEGARSP